MIRISALYFLSHLRLFWRLLPINFINRLLGTRRLAP